MSSRSNFTVQSAQSSGSQWLDEHLETFVRPKLHYIPAIDPKDYWITVFDKKLLAGLAAVWTESKRKAGLKPMLLAGRDVYLLEVLARLEGYPTTFRPEISSCVANSSFITEDYSGHYLVDTGYRGTVPKKLKITHYSLIKWGDSPPYPNPSKIPWAVESKILQARYQLFPGVKRGPLTSLAGHLESVQKYWDLAVVVGLKPHWKIEQKLSHESCFRAAAVLTQHVARNVPRSPLSIKTYMFVRRPVPQGFRSRYL